VSFLERSQFLGQTNFIKASASSGLILSLPFETLPCSAARVFANACNFIETRNGEVLGEKRTRNVEPARSFLNKKYAYAIFYLD